MTTTYPTTDGLTFTLVGAAPKQKLAEYHGGTCSRCEYEELKNAVILAVADTDGNEWETLVGPGCARELLGWSNATLRRRVRITTADLDTATVEALGEGYQLCGWTDSITWASRDSHAAGWVHADAESGADIVTPRGTVYRKCDLCGKHERGLGEKFAAVRVGELNDTALRAHTRCLSKALTIVGVKTGGQPALVKTIAREASEGAMRMWCYLRTGTYAGPRLL